jgi:hypothetical protein
MIGRLPPMPPPGELSRQWAVDITQFIITLMRRTDPATPKTFQLEHIRPDAKAIENGVLMWDETAGTVVVSKDGSWKSLTLAP